MTTQPATASATTDSTGAYYLPLQSGAYNVIFSAPGFNSNFSGPVVVPANGMATAGQSLVPNSALIAQDLFSRPDQTGLGTASDGHAWSNDLGLYPAGQANITARQAFVQTAAANTDHDTWSGIAYRDQEVMADVDAVTVLSDPVYQHGGRLLTRVQGPDIWLTLALNPSNDTVTLWIDNGGNWTQIASASLVLHPGTWYHAKLDAVGTTVQGKAWAIGSAEPTWQVTATQSTLMASGVGGLRVGAADVYFANYSESPITQISGTVTAASSGAALAGATLTLGGGQTTTSDSAGRYTFPSLAAGTYTVTASSAGHAPGSVTVTVSTGLSATGSNLTLS